MSGVILSTAGIWWIFDPEQHNSSSVYRILMRAIIAMELFSHLIHVVFQQATRGANSTGFSAVITHFGWRSAIFVAVMIAV